MARRHRDHQGVGANTVNDGFSLNVPIDMQVLLGKHNSADILWRNQKLSSGVNNIDPRAMHRTSVTR